MNAVVDTLAQSVKTGLNATLTPYDCALILRTLRESNSFSHPNAVFNRVFKRLMDKTESILDELAL